DDLNGLNGNAAVTVNPAAATQLAFGQGPTNTTALAVINPSVKIQALDAYGNSVDGVVVTLSYSGPAGGTVRGTLVRTTSGGVAKVNDLSPDKVGTYTLTASAGSLAPLQSPPFTVDYTVLEAVPSVTHYTTLGHSRT